MAPAGSIGAGKAEVLLLCELSWLDVRFGVGRIAFSKRGSTGGGRLSVGVSTFEASLPASC